jgi:hypothetical protein
MVNEPIENNRIFFLYFNRIQRICRKFIQNCILKKLSMILSFDFIDVARFDITNK